MPFFAERGYECVALSLQGTGGTPGKFQGLLFGVITGFVV